MPPSRSASRWCRRRATSAGNVPARLPAVQLNRQSGHVAGSGHVDRPYMLMDLGAERCDFALRTAPNVACSAAFAGEGSPASDEKDAAQPIRNNQRCLYVFDSRGTQPKVGYHQTCCAPIPVADRSTIIVSIDSTSGGCLSSVVLVWGDGRMHNEQHRYTGKAHDSPVHRRADVAIAILAESPHPHQNATYEPLVAAARFSFYRTQYSRVDVNLWPGYDAQSINRPYQDRIRIGLLIVIR